MKAFRGGLSFIRSKSKHHKTLLVNILDGGRLTAAVTQSILCKLAQLKTVTATGNNNINKMHPALTFLSLFDFTENSSDEMKRDREEKKRYLLRKLSFRPTVEELKSRKVKTTI